jgi:peptidoglycan/LPS O-acetylase OafA/YrhL
VQLVRASSHTVELPYVPSLDGLRGVAVALVVAYHLQPSAVPGGFLGVDVFFVLSGFLITSLAITEVRERGGFRVGKFYLRRARRLLPALLLLLLAVAAYAAWWAEPDELDRLRHHALWTLGYLANWRFISDGTTYTDVLYGQSPLRHTWSLAIEEQFYVLFPLVVLALGRLVRWRPEALRRAVGTVAVVGIVASALWMARLWGDGADPSRGYFGSDTRAHSLLVGVLLGVVLVGRPVHGGRRRQVAAVAAVAGAVGLAAATLTAHEDAGWLQHGGFLAVALAAAALIAGSDCVPPLRWALGRRPLIGLGLISYGVYLWHWPVIVVFDEHRTGIDGPALALFRLGLTLGLALASFVLVERPIRSGALGRTTGRVAIGFAPAGMVLVLVAVTAATVVPTSAPFHPGIRSASAARPDTTRAPVVPVPLDLVIEGDSVAHTLAGGTVGRFPAFEPWEPDQSPYAPDLVSLHSVAKPGCSFLPGELLVAGADPADLTALCRGWEDELESALRGSTRPVVLLALSNDANDRMVDGERVDLGTDEHRALLDRWLDEVRARAHAHGGELALLALPPRAGRAGAAGADDREQVMREELQGYAAVRPGVRVLDLFDAICPGGDCDHPTAGFDPSWRYDGMHYAPPGAQWVAGWITRALVYGSTSS